MLDKEACCLVSQAIYEDLVSSFCNQGLLRSHLGPRVNQSHQVFFICRFPSELRTLQNHKDLFVISEDDLEPIHTALAGTQYISVVLFQVQTHIQEKLSSFTEMPKSSPLYAFFMNVLLMLFVLTSTAGHFEGILDESTAYLGIKILPMHHLAKRRKSPKAFTSSCCTPLLLQAVLKPSRQI